MPYMGVLGSKLRLEAGFDKQLPQGHEYIQTFEKHRDALFGANRLTIAVHARVTVALNFCGARS